METVMHAHRCEACHAKGKDVVWIHSEANRGQVAAHKCPECGQVQWKKWMVEIGHLPRTQNVQQQATNIETVLGYVLFAVALAVLGYCAFLYVKEWREGKKLLP